MKIILTILILVVICLLPVIPSTYEVITWKQIEEKYTTLEPYTVIEQVREPYTAMVDKAEWQDDGSLDRFKNTIYPTNKEYIEAFRAVGPGRYVIKQYPIVKYRVVDKSVTKYKEVTKTRVTDVPTTNKETRLVSITEWMIRR